MWVARNKDGSLELFEGRPHRMNKDNIASEEYREGHWYYYSLHSVIGPHTIQHFSTKMLNQNMFPNLKWEDEPIEINLLSNEQIDEIVSYALNQTGIAEDKQAEIFAYLILHNYFGNDILVDYKK